MSSSDGYIAGLHKIVDHGPNSQRYNIVILGDGYRASELGQYATDVQNFLNTFRATAPYTNLWCGINFFRVDVVSTDSGADDPGTCADGSTGSGATPRTYFDSTFCSDGKIRRLLDCDKASAKATAIAQVPEVHMTMVIVNTSQYGGSGGAVAVFSTASSAAEIGLHEMGHTAFGFADEYEYYQGCGTGETGHDHFSGGEPSEPNVTANTNSATIKWNTLLTNAADGLPTTTNANCGDCDTQANPRGAAYVGAYEGAHYFHCGCYRPSFDCRMRALNNPFCAVCQGVITAALQPFLPVEVLTLTTPSISFLNIPEGLGGVGVTTWRAVVFEVVTCATRTFRITTGPTGGFGVPLGSVVSVSAVDADPVAEARLWLSYTSTTAGATAHGSMTVHCDETAQDWVINIDANTVARPKSAVAMIFDHSGSMADDAGDGQRKVGKLREAANIFVNAMLAGDGISITRFDDTAQLLMPVADVGPAVIGAGRVAAIGHINGPELDPAGATSIGAGVVTGKGSLDAAQAAASPHYDVTAMLVLTDGEENTPPMLADVSGSITANTFAIGLGLPENISVPALTALTQGHQGYLLVTGTLTSDQSARLNKYFLQILAGITNANVILDPPGVLVPGAIQRIPFQVSETDFGLDAFLLCPTPYLVDFELETPDGSRLSPSSASALSNLQFVQAGGLAYFRLSLPAIPPDPAGSHAGTWNAVLSLRRGQIGLGVASFAVGGSIKGGGLPYDFVVHCYSNLDFRAYAHQGSFEPGAIVNLVASLKEYDAPVDHRAKVWASVTRPDGGSFNVTLDEIQPGVFTGSFATTLPGLYTVRARSMGATFYGRPFQREQTLTAAVYPGGDKPPQAGGGGDHWCELLRCLVASKAIDTRLIERLHAMGFDVQALLKCLGKECAERPRLR